MGTRRLEGVWGFRFCEVWKTNRGGGGDDERLSEHGGRGRRACQMGFRPDGIAIVCWAGPLRSDISCSRRK